MPSLASSGSVHPRSYLLTPGHQPGRLRTALDSGVDCVIAELEDGVPPDRKDEARETTRSVLDERDASTRVYVRINPLDDGGESDVAALLDGGAPPDGVLLPKPHDAAAVRALGTLLADHGATVGVHPVIESPNGVVNLREIVSVDCVEGVQFGPGDLAAGLGILPTDEMDELTYARQKLVLTAAAAGVQAVDAPSREIRDADAVRADAERSAALGFDGKVAVHPAQLDPIHDVFYPSEAEVEWARRVLEERAAAAARDEAVFQVDGEVVLHPHVVRAEEIVAHAAAPDAPDPDD